MILCFSKISIAKLRGLVFSLIDLISCKRCFKIRTSIVPAPHTPTPPIGQDENSDDSDFHSESEDENCEECQKQKQQELIDSLPQQVLSGKREMDDLGNSYLTYKA